MILQVKTEKELIAMIEALSKEVQQLRLQNKPEAKSLNNNDVLELISKHVTMDYVNKLYKKGG